jgi:hypothetical protein
MLPLRARSAKACAVASYTVNCSAMIRSDKP